MKSLSRTALMAMLAWILLSSSSCGQRVETKEGSLHSPETSASLQAQLTASERPDRLAPDPERLSLRVVIQRKGPGYLASWYDLVRGVSVRRVLPIRLSNELPVSLSQKMFRRLEVLSRSSEPAEITGSPIGGTYDRRQNPAMAKHFDLSHVAPSSSIGEPVVIAGILRPHSGNSRWGTHDLLSQGRVIPVGLDRSVEVGESSGVLLTGRLQIWNEKPDGAPELGMIDTSLSPLSLPTAVWGALSLGPSGEMILSGYGSHFSSSGGVTPIGIPPQLKVQVPAGLQAAFAAILRDCRVPVAGGCHVNLSGEFAPDSTKRNLIFLPRALDWSYPNPYNVATPVYSTNITDLLDRQVTKEKSGPLPCVVTRWKFKDPRIGLSLWEGHHLRGERARIVPAIREHYWPSFWPGPDSCDERMIEVLTLDAKEAGWSGTTFGIIQERALRAIDVRPRSGVQEHKEYPMSLKLENPGSPLDQIAVLPMFRPTEYQWSFYSPFNGFDPIESSRTSSVAGRLVELSSTGWETFLYPRISDRRFILADSLESPNIVPMGGVVGPPRTLDDGVTHTLEGSGSVRATGSIRTRLDSLIGQPAALLARTQTRGAPEAISVLPLERLPTLTGFNLQIELRPNDPSTFVLTSPTGERYRIWASNIDGLRRCIGSRVIRMTGLVRIGTMGAEEVFYLDQGPYLTAFSGASFSCDPVAR